MYGQAISDQWLVKFPLFTKIHQNDTKLIKINSGNIYKTHQIKHKNKKKILIKRETYN